MTMEKHPNGWNILGLNQPHRRFIPKQIKMTPLDARYMLRMSQSNIARSLGISLRTWQNYESGDQAMSAMMFYALRYLIYTQNKTADNALTKTIQHYHKRAEKDLADMYFGSNAEKSRSKNPDDPSGLL